MAKHLFRLWQPFGYVYALTLGKAGCGACACHWLPDIDMETAESSTRTSSTFDSAIARMFCTMRRTNPIAASKKKKLAPLAGEAVRR